jgi:hypothetical protein
VRSKTGPRGCHRSRVEGLRPIGGKCTRRPGNYVSDFGGSPAGSPGGYPSLYHSVEDLDSLYEDPEDFTADMSTLMASSGDQISWRR